MKASAVLQVLFSPELALEAVDFTVHGIGRLCGVLQLPLKFSSVGVGSLSLLLSLLQLTLELLHARVQLVDLKEKRKNKTIKNFCLSPDKVRSTKTSPFDESYKANVKIDLISIWSITLFSIHLNI